MAPLIACEVVTRVEPRNLAVAYSDLDGDGRYGSGDVLTSRLFDTNGDSVPSKGDTIYMGRYPVDFEMMAFADFGVETHEVVGVDVNFDTRWKVSPWVLTRREVAVFTTRGNTHWWKEFGDPYDDYPEEGYSEESHYGPTGFGDSDVALDDLGFDDILVVAGSPSHPQVPVPYGSQSRSGAGADDFINVEVFE